MDGSRHVFEAETKQDRRLREDEAGAAEANASAEMARAEAQKRELEAERLADEAQSRSEGTEAVRQERDEQPRLADLRDPDVETDRSGYRLDLGADRGETRAERTDEPADLDQRRAGTR
jgi:hypothetical protein